MSTAEDFNKLYAEVGQSIEDTLSDISEIHVENEDGKKQLNAMTAELKNLQYTFNQKLSYLEHHAEWDKFTLAFFGETNAGKSTIIESLRILFNETSRQNLLHKNKNDLKQAEQEILANLTQLRSDLGKVYIDVADKIKGINLSAAHLQEIISNESVSRLKIEEAESQLRFQLEKNESACRVRVEEEESQARLRLEENESQLRLQILQKQINGKTRIKLLATAIISLLIGSGLMFLINQFTGINYA